MLEMTIYVGHVHHRSTNVCVASILTMCFYAKICTTRQTRLTCLSTMKIFFIRASSNRRVLTLPRCVLLCHKVRSHANSSRCSLSSRFIILFQSSVCIYVCIIYTSGIQPYVHACKHTRTYITGIVCMHACMHIYIHIQCLEFQHIAVCMCGVSITLVCNGFVCSSCMTQNQNIWTCVVEEPHLYVHVPTKHVWFVSELRFMEMISVCVCICVCIYMCLSIYTHIHIYLHSIVHPGYLDRLDFSVFVGARRTWVVVLYTHALACCCEVAVDLV